jgi:4-hydroxy-tetrahydrodipicolinate synthase
MIKGSLVAIVTPMHEDGSIDYERYRKLIDWHVASGTAAIVAVGTTGESPTVDVDEHCELVRVAVQQTAGRIPVIAGTGGNSTREAIELTAFAKTAGATSSLQVVPYYNRPTQEGMYRHFRAVTEAVDLPIIVYNVPGRTVADLANDTVERLAELPLVIGIKDATGDIPRGSDLIGRLPARFAIYSGNDDSALALMAMGSHGVISVVANLAPLQMAQMCAAALSGDWTRARALNQKLLPLHLKLFVEANPIPVKWAMQQMGLIDSGIRLPMTPLSGASQEIVASALRAADITVMTR